MALFSSTAINTVEKSPKHKAKLVTFYLSRASILEPSEYCNLLAMASAIFKQNFCEIIVRFNGSIDIIIFSVQTSNIPNPK